MLIIFTSLPEVGGHGTITLDLCAMLGECDDHPGVVIVREMPGFGTSVSSIARLQELGYRVIQLGRKRNIVRNTVSLWRLFTLRLSATRGSVCYLAIGMRNLSPIFARLLRPAVSVYYYITHELTPQNVQMLLLYARRFDRVAFISPATHEAFSSATFGELDSKCLSLFQPSEIPSAAVPRRAERDSVSFGFIGRLNDAKGSGVLSEFAQTTTTNCRLVVAGWGERVDEFKGVKSRGACRIDYRGRFDPSQKAEFLGAFFPEIDYLIVPSQDEREGIPTVILESWQFGVPVIATRCGGTVALESIAGEGSPAIRFVPKDAVGDELTRLAAALPPTEEAQQTCRALYAANFCNAVIRQRWQAALELSPTDGPPRTGGSG